MDAPQFSPWLVSLAVGHLLVMDSQGLASGDQGAS